MAHTGPRPSPTAWLQPGFVTQLRRYSDANSASQRDLGDIVGLTQGKFSAAVRGLPFTNTPLSRRRWETLARLIGYADRIFSDIQTSASWKAR